MTIHQSAVIAKSAIVPESTNIGPNVVIGENVVLGENVNVIANAYLEYCEIGDGTVVSPFASIGTAPQDLGYKNEPTKAVIGKNCIIKENVTVHRASGEGNATVVGDKCLLMASSHVAHNCQIADEVIMANLATLGGYCEVGYGAFIGGMSVFHQHVRIGEMCIVSGFSASRQDILPYSKGDGRPPVPVSINVVALKRRRVDLETRTHIHEAFKLLISPEYNTTQAIEKIKAEIPTNKYIEKMIDFVQTSKRGVLLKNHKSGHHTLESKD